MKKDPTEWWDFLCHIPASKVSLAMRFINFNGKIVPETQPIIGANNRGLRYGDGLFETILLHNGKLIFEDDHFARLWNGLKLLQFDLPKLFTPELLIGHILQLAQKNGHTKPTRVRLEMVRGDGGLYDAVNHTPQYIIQTWELPEGALTFNSNGLILDIYPDVRKSCDAVANCKHNNYLPYVLAALFAKQQKCNDAIVLNQHGRVCDSTIANLFYAKDGQLFTPSLDEAPVAGTVRAQICRLMAQQGNPVLQQPVTIDELLAADEVFLTSSIHPVKWVQRIGEKTYLPNLSKSIFDQLLATF